MDSRERVTTMPHLSRGVGVPGTGGGGGAAAAMYRNVVHQQQQQSNGNVVSRGSTLERPVGRSMAHPQVTTTATVPGHHLVTTQVDVEHHHPPQQHQQQQHYQNHPRPDLRSPLPAESQPFPVFDTNQVGGIYCTVKILLLNFVYSFNNFGIEILFGLFFSTTEKI